MRKSHVLHGTHPRTLQLYVQGGYERFEREIAMETQAFIWIESRHDTLLRVVISILSNSAKMSSKMISFAFELELARDGTHFRNGACHWRRSSLKRLEDCPHQGCEGAPEAWLEIAPAFTEGLDGIIAGSKAIVLTWFHRARRDLLKLHPRNDPGNPIRGVFTTRSPHRPNPVGLHQVEVLEVDNEGRIKVRALEALDGTPIIDIKPVLP
jgi:tRNA-Thr(GGU) m(6)t(6)A37 methyltransferase TsaA